MTTNSHSDLQVLRYDGTEPKRAHPTDAGYDLVSAQHRVIESGDWTLIRTGTRVQIPAGHVGFVCSRSGLALKHGVAVLNAPGVVDSGYNGDVGVILHNTGREPFEVQKGDRIAQLVIVPIVTPVMVADDLDATSRGDAGFGSTGR